MTTAVLVETIRAAGVRLVPDGEKILLVPPGVLSPDLRAALIEAKAEVLAHLATSCCTIGRSDPAPCPSCGYVHADMTVREPCSRCGSEVWTASLVDATGTGRVCAGCVLATGRAGESAPEGRRTGPEATGDVTKRQTMSRPGGRDG